MRLIDALMICQAYFTPRKLGWTTRSHKVDREVSPIQRTGRDAVHSGIFPQRLVKAFPVRSTAKAGNQPRAYQFGNL